MRAKRRSISADDHKRHRPVDARLLGRNCKPARYCGHAEWHSHVDGPDRQSRHHKRSAQRDRLRHHMGLAQAIWMNRGGETMIIRLACFIPVFLLLACVSPEEQARQQAAAAAAIRFTDENRCRIQGFQEGSDAFAQCVRMTIDQQSRPHRCTYCRSLD